MRQGNWNLKKLLCVCVPNRGKRLSKARIPSGFVGLGVLLPTSDNLKVAIAHQVQDFALCGLGFAD